MREREWERAKARARAGPPVDPGTHTHTHTHTDTHLTHPHASPAPLPSPPPSHSQVVEDGYEFFAGRQLVTVFSAPNYCGEFNNAGGILVLEEDMMCSFQIISPQM